MSSAPAQGPQCFRYGFCGPRAFSRRRIAAAPMRFFRDPYAEKLGAQRGGEMARTLPQGLSHAWAWGGAHLFV